MTIREWIRQRALEGIPTFTAKEVREAFVRLSGQVIQSELSRLSAKKIITSVYRGFYVIVPVHYQLKGIVPPYYYIDQLMEFVGKPYYISLLSAAALLGAAHQQPQVYFVTTILPKHTVSKRKNKFLVWAYRAEMPTDCLLKTNSETASMYYSNPELTAVDLVQYAWHIGGLSRAATVLIELSERLDFKDASKTPFPYTTLATIQRLGYILEEALGYNGIADTLYEELKLYAKHFRYVWLSTRHPNRLIRKSNRWKVNVNSEIEPDDI